MTQTKAATRRDFLQRTLGVGVGMSIAAHAAGVAESTSPNEEAADVWRIGCYTRPWGEYDYRTALDAIAEAGFKYAGLMTTKSPTGLVISTETTEEEATQIGEECRKRGLSVPSVYGGGIPVATSLDAGIAGLRRLIDACAIAGAENLMMGGVGDPGLYEPYYTAVAKCCEYALEKRVGISVKPHGGLNATGPQCRKAVEFVHHANFRVWYDPGNIFYYSDGQLDPVDDAATVDGLVVGMCVKDYRHPKEVMITPGTGQVDFPAVMARLRRGGFTGGALVVECLAPGDLAQTLEEAKKARQFVESLQKVPSSA